MTQSFAFHRPTYLAHRVADWRLGSMRRLVTLAGTEFSTGHGD